MKIEKLEFGYNNYDTGQEYIAILHAFNKINELIDAFETTKEYTNCNYHFCIQQINKINEYLSKDKDVKEEKEPEILICPFCGEKPDLAWDDENKNFIIKCNYQECLIVETTTPSTKQEAIHAWNKRAK